MTKIVKLLIDAGHGGTDSGAVYDNAREKDFTLRFTLAVRNYLLTKYKVDITLTRDSDKSLSLTQRTNLANSLNVNYFVSIHINAGGGSGFESYIYNGSVPSSTVTQQNIIHQAIMSKIRYFGVIDRGKKRNDFQVLRETNMSAILLENLFIDTSRDLSLLRNSSFNAALVVGISEGIAQALFLPKK